MTTELTIQSATEMVKADVNELIKQMMVLEQADCPVMHHFADGVYIREVRFPTGSLVVGHIQKHEHMNVFIQGSVKMLGNDGSHRILTAPMTFVGQPGRKVGYVLEDVIWQNIFPNPDNCRDIEVLEDRWLIQTPYFDEYKVQLSLLAAPSTDYDKMLIDLGVTAEQVETESQITDDLIEMPAGWEKVAVRKSSIHGQGLFAEANIVSGETVCPARVDGKRTPACRYTNHSGTPNVVAVSAYDGIWFIATKDIHGRRGGFNGEEITVDYRQVYAVVRGEAE